MTTAYLDNPALKASVLEQLKAHRLADELVKGRYWEDGKGCAVGCLVHSGDHTLVTKRYGWPLPIAYLTDTIFEGLPNAAAQLWPERIAGAIKPGQDLSRIHWRFLHWLLTDEAVNPGINHPLVRDAVAQCAIITGRRVDGKRVTESAAESAARSAAWSAAWSAERAARSVAESAARSAARSAAWSAAWSARSAAWSAAESIARSAAWSARSAAWSAARSAESAARSAESAAYILMADKLIALIEAEPPTLSGEAQT